MASDSSSVVTSANESKKTYEENRYIFHTSVVNTMDYKTLFGNKLGLIHKANFRFRLVLLNRFLKVLQEVKEYSHVQFSVLTTSGRCSAEGKL